MHQARHLRGPQNGNECSVMCKYFFPDRCDDDSLIFIYTQNAQWDNDSKTGKYFSNLFLLSNKKFLHKFKYLEEMDHSTFLILI